MKNRNFSSLKQRSFFHIFFCCFLQILTLPQVYSQINPDEIFLLPGGESEFGQSYIAPPPPGGNFHIRASFLINFINEIPSQNEIWTPQMKSAMNYAAQLWSERLGSSVPIVIDAKLSSDSSRMLRALAVTDVRYVFGREVQGTQLSPHMRFPTALANKLARYDVKPTEADMEITFATNALLSTGNPNAEWYFGLDGNVSASNPRQYDFVTAAIHEIGHGLIGGSSFSYDFRTGRGYYGPLTVMDSFLIDCIGFNHPRLTSYTSGTAELGNILIGTNTGGASRVCWAFLDSIGGCMDKNGFPIKMWSTISTFVPRGTIAHLDEGRYSIGDSNSLMTPTLHTGEAIHSIGDLFACMLDAVGWNVFYEPESSPPPSGRIKDSSITDWKSLVMHAQSAENQQDSNASFSIRICDISGRKLKELPYSNEFTQVIRSSGFPNGLFLLYIVSENGSIIEVKKVFVVNE